ncbi:SDR family NAD(P)-dependent oxidoreductase [Burkholderia cenocepacia]|uniref:SDR family NAD(P)-dependent oxidoreductase n=1 Tax=Burkholderia cenocepacia TaxID=95486 RepID=UPI000F5AF998|nr:SDR family NAD(P)-dependent oxidoreductase [Burkholderia cenocepacia]RQU63352.1 SDR family NAD(P)-dependent oxidoreductase [Burkholderia cenocepacia]RQV46610.1 SDR family NAD(P)-dependent oxidoreductase [Burkholderia cenocepacia]
MKRVAPRNIVITGASAGLGHALARAYAEPGAVLGIIGRDLARLEQCAVLCKSAGARQVIVGSIDVRNAAHMRSWLSEFDSAHPIDLLIANAGIASTVPNASDWEDLGRTAAVVDTNFYGALHAVLPVIEQMRARRSGHIAMVSSIAALRGMAISPAYCASKAAVKAYGDSVRPLLKRYGVTLSVILPGFVKTEMSDVFPGDKPSMWSAEKAANHIRSRLLARQAEIAFPGHLALGTRILALMPAILADAILERLSYLPREGR